MAAPAVPVIQTHASDGGLASCLAIARVKPELSTFMKDTLRMESLHDFFFYVAKDAWEAELDVKVVKPAHPAGPCSDGVAVGCQATGCCRGSGFVFRLC